MVLILFIFNMKPLPAMAIGEETQAQSISGITININGNDISLGNNTTYSLDSHLLLPLRLLFESMGSVVDWDSATNMIHAERNDKIVELTIDSAEAYINGETVILETKAIAINNSTYIPLRFVGEAFGGTVTWDQASKTVNIVLPDSSIRESPDMTVYLNNTVLEFDLFPLIIDNNKYLPLDEFLDFAYKNLPEEYHFSWMKADDGGYAITFDGVTRTIYPDLPNIYINGLEATINYYPISVDGMVYMPIRMVEEVLNGKVQWDQSAKINYIYITRAKFKTQFLTKTEDNGVLPVNIPTASLFGERQLTVSDDPEIISPSILKKDSAVLWLSNRVSLSGKDSQEHRVFGWHINDMDQDIRIGVVIENLGTTTLSISDTRHFYRTTPNGWADYDVGLPIAEAILNKSMNITLPMDVVLKPGNSLLLQEFDLSDGELLGFINDFTVTNNNKSTKGKYQIRVVVSTIDDDLQEITGSPLPIKRGRFHTRGNWSASTIEASTPTYKAGSQQIAYSISNGVTDNLFTAKNSLTNGFSALNNTGHFGATYLVNIPIENDTGKEVVIRIQLSSRGGLYAGAILTPDGVSMIPEIKAAQGMANLYEYNAPEGKSALTLELMHAGGSYLPVAINISTDEEDSK